MTWTVTTLTSADANERGDGDGIGLIHPQQVLLNVCTTIGASVSSYTQKVALQRRKPGDKKVIKIFNKLQEKV